MRRRTLVALGVAAGLVLALTGCGEAGPTYEEQCEALGGTVISQADTVYVWGSKGGGFATVTDRDCIGAEVTE